MVLLAVFRGLPVPTSYADEDVLALQDVHLLEALSWDEGVDLTLPWPVQQHQPTVCAY